MSRNSLIKNQEVEVTDVSGCEIIPLKKMDSIELTEYSSPNPGSSSASPNKLNVSQCRQYDEEEEFHVNLISPDPSRRSLKDTCRTDDIGDNGDTVDDIISEYPASGSSSPDSASMFGSPMELLEDFQDTVEQSCCWKVLKSIWKTRLTISAGNSEDRDSYVKTTLRELTFYIGFVIVLCLITYSMTSATMFYFAKNTKALFIDDDVIAEYRSMGDFFQYTDDRLLPGLYWEKYYNNLDVPKKYQGYIYFENKVLGRPRLRQLRVRNNTCTIASNFKRHVKKCYGRYSHGNEEKTPYGIRKWKYYSSEELGGHAVRGELRSYGGGGYTVLLGDNEESSRNILYQLASDFWLDRGTRVVFIEFTVYNGNINLFCIVTLIFEFPETGGMNIYHNFNTLKILRYVTGWDYFVLACEIVFIIYLIYYTIEEFVEISVNRWSYFKGGWNVFDLIIIIMGYITITFSLYTHFKAKSILKELVHKTTEYGNFGGLGYYQRMYNELMAVFVLLAWIKLFKYLNFNKTMMHLHSTLSRCAKDVAGFAVMFLIIFIAFSAWGNMIFGTQLKTHDSFANSMNTLFRLLLGDFDFYEMRDVHPVIGPIYFVLYVFFIFFVLINMFLAIVADTYAEVKEDMETEVPEFNVAEYLSRNYKKMTENLLSSRKKIQDIKQALATADTNNDNYIDYDEWRATIKVMGFTDTEIECVFAKYDLDGDRRLDMMEIQLMHDDLNEDKVALDEELEELSQEINESEKGEEGDGDSTPKPVRKRRRVPFEKFTVLNRRVDRLEHSTGNILSKVDLVMTKMAKADKRLLQRRSTMARVLEGLVHQGSMTNGCNMVRDMEELVREELGKWEKVGDEFKSREDMVAC